MLYITERKLLRTDNSGKCRLMKKIIAGTAIYIGKGWFRFIKKVG